MRIWLIAFTLVASPSSPAGAAESADKAYAGLAEEAVAASLAWRPLDATNIGLHEYDGKTPDYRKSAIAAGTVRLQSCLDGLQRLDPSALSPRNRYDRLLIVAGLKRDLFWLSSVRRFSSNPMVLIPTWPFTFSRTSPRRLSG